MNLGYIDFLLSSQEFNIASISLVLSLSLWSFLLSLLLLLFYFLHSPILVLFLFILFYFFVSVSPFQTRALYFFYCRHCRCRFFCCSFSWQSFCICLFVCFFSFGFLFAPAIFTRLIYDEHKKAQMAESIYFIQIDRWSLPLSHSLFIFYAYSQSVLSNSIIPSLAAYFTMLIVIFFLYFSRSSRVNFAIEIFKLRKLALCKVLLSAPFLSPSLSLSFSISIIKAILVSRTQNPKIYTLYVSIYIYNINLFGISRSYCRRVHTIKH